MTKRYAEVCPHSVHNNLDDARRLSALLDSVALCIRTPPWAFKYPFLSLYPVSLSYTVMLPVPVFEQYVPYLNAISGSIHKDLPSWIPVHKECTVSFIWQHNGTYFLNRSQFTLSSRDSVTYRLAS